MSKQLYVYDLEVFPNFFSCSALDVMTQERVIMYLYTREQGTPLQDIINWLKNQVSGLIGYNNLNYDYPVLHQILLSAPSWIAQECSPENICSKIYQISKSIISEDYSSIPDYRTLIPQLDLYAIHHFDNPAKRTSLKDLEIAMRWDRVQDLPHPFDHLVRLEEIADILEYNMNDVLATYAFYKHSSGEINLRKQLTVEYQINLINANDPKIGSEIFAKLLSQRLGIPIKELRKLRTYRDSITLDELVLPTVNFTTPKFQSLLANIRSQVITETKGAMKNTVVHKGFKYDFGLGGLHGCTKAGVQLATPEMMICSCDVASLYPSIAINNGYYPEHLGEDFVEVYRDIRDQRLAAKKAGNKVKDGGLKLAINGCYGKSNDQYSFLYDPQFTMSITVNGQLLLAMLCERLQEISTLLMVNTDGIECLVRVEHFRLYLDICAQWELETGLVLEQATYDKLVIRDINNYIGVSGKKVKLKGAFEIDKGWYKDTSSKVVAKAIYAYYVDGVDPREFIRSHTDIYDFCNRFKATHGWHSETRCLGEYAVTSERHQKTNRYYMSTRGKRFYKVHQDGRQQLIEAVGEVVIFNNYVPMEDYRLDYDYYLREVNKILHVIDQQQLTLF